MSKRYPSMKMVSPEALGETIHFPFSKRTAPNRFLKTALSENLSSWDPEDRERCGVPGQDLVRLYQAWAEGGSGLILTGNVMVVEDHLENKRNMMVPPDAPIPESNADYGNLGKQVEEERFAAFQTIAAAGKSKRGLMVAQISHPGRQTAKDINTNPVSASDVQLVKHEHPLLEFAKPHPASQDEINYIVRAFVHTAVYLEAAGFDGVQLHGAHGYLLAQFLSYTTNKRTDQYGGDLESRTRIIKEIARGIREQCRSDFILGIKLNSVEFQESGLQAEEAKVICQILEREKFDFIELSGGSYQEFAWKHKRNSTKAREGYFMQWADLIVPQLSKTKSYVTGGFKTVPAMINALKTIEGIGLGRPICQEPALPSDMVSGKIIGCIQGIVPDDQYFLTATIAGAHILQLAEGQLPFDASQQKEVDKFMAALDAFSEELKSGKVLSWPRMM